MKRSFANQGKNGPKSNELILMIKSSSGRIEKYWRASALLAIKMRCHDLTASDVAMLVWAVIGDRVMHRADVIPHQ
jgi:hypothetical protein